jgi:hypothetical protein
MQSIVKQLLDKHVEGTPFFDALDDELRKPANFSIVESLFNPKIENLVAIGRFGLYIQGLINEDIVDVQGSICILSGGLRHGKPLRQSMSRGPIRDRSFVFIDDSFYKGRTLRATADYLRRWNSTISEVRVAYDGSREIPVRSLYRYHPIA